MSGGRKPDPCSNVGRIRQFFLDNPDEELTYHDMAVKLEIPLSRVYTLVRVLDRDGICEPVRVIRAKQKA